MYVIQVLGINWQSPLFSGRLKIASHLVLGQVYLISGVSSLISLASALILISLEYFTRHYRFCLLHTTLLLSSLSYGYRRRQLCTIFFFFENVLLQAISYGRNQGFGCFFLFKDEIVLSCLMSMIANRHDSPYVQHCSMIYTGMRVGNVYTELKCSKSARSNTVVS